jgi:hypothetical protein
MESELLRELHALRSELQEIRKIVVEQDEYIRSIVAQIDEAFTRMPKLPFLPRVTLNAGRASADNA